MLACLDQRGVFEGSVPASSKSACDPRLETERDVLGRAGRSNDEVDVIGSRVGREPVPPAILANVTCNALDDGPRPRVEEPGRHPCP